VTGLSGAAQRVLELTGLLERLRDPAAFDADEPPDQSGPATGQ
jgi:hypothetical protein